MGRSRARHRGSASCRTWPGHSETAPRLSRSGSPSRCVAGGGRFKWGVISERAVRSVELATQWMPPRHPLGRLSARVLDRLHIRCRPGWSTTTTTVPITATTWPAAPRSRSRTSSAADPADCSLTTNQAIQGRRPVTPTRAPAALEGRRRNRSPGRARWLGRLSCRLRAGASLGSRHVRSSRRLHTTGRSQPVRSGRPTKHP